MGLVNVTEKYHMNQMPDMNKVAPSSGMPARAPDGRYRIALRKAYPHTSGFDNSLLAVIEYEVKEIVEQRPTEQQSTTGGVVKKQPIPTVLVGDVRSYKIKMTDKSGPGDWRRILELLAGHAQVNEDVKDWTKFSNDVMGKENPIEGLEFDLEVSSKITGRGNTFGTHRFSYGK